jgi:subtilisin family serine protease
MIKHIIFFATLLIFIGCGGGGESSITNNKTTMGRLLDSAISGVSYNCGSTRDITTTGGIFVCPINTTVTFTIGGITLGKIILTSSQNLQDITPAKLYNLKNDNYNDKRILNFIRLVQTLDDDNNASNGIYISSYTKEKLSKKLDISDIKTTEEDLEDTLKIIDKDLITKDIALMHYKNTIINLPLEDIIEPYYNQQWYINKNETFYSKNNIDDDANINVTDIMENYTGKGVKIAIIDNGLDTTHEDLKDAIIETYDIRTNTSNVSHTKAEDIHGTAVTGIIGARANNKGILGIASQSQIIFLKMSNFMSDSQLIEIFNKADEFKADIINCSWGSVNTVSEAVKETIIKLSKDGRDGNGTIIVFASGNTGKDRGDVESEIPEVISVGATNKNNLRTSYSSLGKNLDIVAPGGEFKGITTLNPIGKSKGKNLIHSNNYLLYNDKHPFIGTSAATPIVSGVIALMLEKKPDLTRVEIEKILHDTSDQIGEETYDNDRNDYYGYGKINLTKIMEKIKLYL